MEEGIAIMNEGIELRCAFIHSIPSSTRRKLPRTLTEAIVTNTSSVGVEFVEHSTDTTVIEGLGDQACLESPKRDILRH
jgi:hypothetical protein